jgi:RecA-family ATPase
MHLTPYMQAAIEGELAKLRGCTSGQDTAMNTAAFQLAAMVLGWGLSEAGIRAQFIDACWTLPNLKSAKGDWTLKHFEDKWRHGMRDAEPRALPSNGQAGVHKTAHTVHKKEGAKAKLSGVVLPEWTPPGEDGRPKFELDPPGKTPSEIRRHYYYRNDSGEPVRCKIKYARKDRSASWVDYYNVRDENGRCGWQAKRPEGYIETPYYEGAKPFDPELIDDLLCWTEGEKDTDTLEANGEIAISFGSSSVIVKAFEELRGRKIVVFGDNDEPGRIFARRQADAVRDIAASVKTYTFPDLPLGGDVTDFITAHGIEALLEIVDGLEESGDETFPVVNAGKLLQKPAPERLWLVPDWVPWGDVTGLGADGGTGKTTLALQLGVACATGTSWLGKATRQCPVLYLSAEDDLNELHFRLEKIAHHMEIARAVDDLYLAPLAGKDALLAGPAPEGGVKASALLASLEHQITVRKAGLVILDSAADVFGGNENDRIDVRSFVNGILRGCAMKYSCSIVILLHPSVDGMKTGRGYSGSTAWNAALRSRMYFTKATAQEEGEEDSAADRDLRLLELAKTNRAATGLKMLLRWCDGRFIAEQDGGDVDSIIRRIDCEELFVELLETFEKEGRPPSPNKGWAYAPFLFAQHPAGKSYKSKEYRDAMNILLGTGRIKIEVTGPKSRPIQTLKIVVST